MTLSEYSVNKPVTVLLVFIALIGLGIFCTTQLPVDMYPNMKLPYMLVYTEYKNAGNEARPYKKFFSFSKESAPSAPEISDAARFVHDEKILCAIV